MGDTIVTTRYDPCVPETFMTSALKHQIAAYAHSVTELIPDAGELGDLISVGLQLVDAIGASIKRWQDRIKAGEVKFQTTDAQGYMDGYAELQRAFIHLEHLSKSGDKTVIPLEEMARLTDAKIELGTMLKISVSSMERAQEQFRRGEGRPLQEVRDELRRRLGA
jgi:hypothetical protein